MWKAIFWTHQVDAALDQAFLDIVEQTKSIETTTKLFLKYISRFQY